MPDHGGDVALLQRPPGTRREHKVTLAAPPGLQLAAEVVGQRRLDGRGDRAAQMTEELT